MNVEVPPLSVVLPLIVPTSTPATSSSLFETLSEDNDKALYLVSSVDIWKSIWYDCVPSVTLSSTPVIVNVW